MHYDKLIVGNLLHPLRARPLSGMLNSEEIWPSISYQAELRRDANTNI
jgi:hypothetical protein